MITITIRSFHSKLKKRRSCVIIEIQSITLKSEMPSMNNVSIKSKKSHKYYKSAIPN